MAILDNITQTVKQLVQGKNYRGQENLGPTTRRAVRLAIKNPTVAPRVAQNIRNQPISQQTNTIAQSQLNRPTAVNPIVNRVVNSPIGTGISNISNTVQKLLEAPVIRQVSQVGRNVGTALRAANIPGTAPITKLDIPELSRVTGYDPTTGKRNALKGVGQVALDTAKGAGTLKAIATPANLLAGAGFSVGFQLLDDAIKGKPINKDSLKNLGDAGLRGAESAWVLPITNAVTDKIAGAFFPTLTSQALSKSGKAIVDQAKAKGLTAGWTVLRNMIGPALKRALLETPIESLAYGTKESIERKEPWTESVAKQVVSTLFTNVALAGLFTVGKAGKVESGEIAKRVTDLITGELDKVKADPSFLNILKDQRGFIQIPGGEGEPSKANVLTDLTAQLGREPTVGEIQARLRGVSVDDIKVGKSMELDRQIEEVRAKSGVYGQEVKQNLDKTAGVNEISLAAPKKGVEMIKKGLSPSTSTLREIEEKTGTDVQAQINQFIKDNPRYQAAENNTVRLYRGLEQPFDPNFDLSKTDAGAGYSTWTDNPELAKQYAGKNGYVYQIDLPKKQQGQELIGQDGDRALFINNEKKAGLNGVNGQEYLVYNDHELYDPNQISKFGKQNAPSPAGPPPTGNSVDLPGGKQRKFLETVQEAEGTSPELKQGVSEVVPQTYEPLANKTVIDRVKGLVIDSPDEAKTRVFSDEPISADKSTLAVLLAKKYESEGNLDSAVEVIENYDKQLREAGRFIQAASLWGNLAPENLLRTANKVAENHGIKLSSEVQENILSRARELDNLAPEFKEKEMPGLVNYIAENIPLGKSELFDAYRYNNMLSGPRTSYRNTFQNLTTTLITRPADLAFQAGYEFARHPFNPIAREAHFSDLPIYYKNVLTTIPDAFVAAQGAFRDTVGSDKLDIGQYGANVIEAARKQKTPMAISLFPRFMEAQDKFFSALISTGEYNRLLAQGIDEDTAQAQARTMAERYLLRTPLGKTGAADPLLVQALDWTGKALLNIRKMPVIGKPFGWFVPFVTTPLNAAKEQIRHSPAGIIGGSGDSLQKAQAGLGTVLLGIGGMYALQNRTTWEAPTDPTAKDNFYASGRKPFSIKVGNNWVPMWYFGTMGLPFAMAAAVKHYYTDSNKAFTDSDFEKISKSISGLSKFIVNQTPLQGVAGVMRLLEGDQDASIGNTLGFTVGQVIPYSGFIRYISTLVDPVYRQAKGALGTLMRDLPLLSTELPAYTNPYGEKEMRNASDYIAPYSVGISDNRFEQMYRDRIKELQSNSVDTGLDRGTITPQEAQDAYKRLYPPGR